MNKAINKRSPRLAQRRATEEWMSSMILSGDSLAIQARLLKQLAVS
jgi:hypothetical protein